MAILNMARTKLTSPEQSKGAIYSTRLSLTIAQSDTYLLPINRVYGISFYLDGTGEIYVTNDPDGLIGFEAWDGVSQISNAITAFYVTRTAGTVTAKITVKTDNE